MAVVTIHKTYNIQMPAVPPAVPPRVVPPERVPLIPGVPIPALERAPIERMITEQKQKQSVSQQITAEHTKIQLGYERESLGVTKGHTMENQKILQGTKQRAETSKLITAEQKVQNTQARMFSGQVLAMNMSMLGVLFSMMTMNMQLKIMMGLSAEQGKIFDKWMSPVQFTMSLMMQIMSIVLATTSAAQFRNTLEQQLTTEKAKQVGVTAAQLALEKKIAVAKLAQYGIYAVIAAGFILMAIAMVQAKMAQYGAVVTPRPGGVPLIVGEGREVEIVTPEPLLRRIIREEGGPRQVNIYAIDVDSAARIWNKVVLDSKKRGVRARW